MTPDQLKASILQYAMEGKLVPQDLDDEPASELLAKIQQEKAQLIKEKKIKKTKPLPAISEDEIPFEIPDSWEWVRFGELVTFYLGKTPKRVVPEYWEKESKKGIPWVSIADINSSKIFKTKENVSKKAIEEVFSNKIVPKGTLIMSFKLSIGKVGILERDMVHNEAIIDIHPLVDEANIQRDYLYHFLPLISQSGDFSNAVKGKTLNKTSLSMLLVPLPPLAEQKRIVDKIDKMFEILN
ncbi:hypothetical protein ME806_18390 [Lactobacillus delbrueckii]|uniref:restriction endonuclease subunit S n=1 Tax=Lactobacillus delbrueckii TaxID=1584 RepID=UPI001F304A6E|nr:restriction endonuclease subunit S [Lactobacillus delbrueckii]GHN61543.1 hypothetical protein ME806_18390 [Lactobacillus delbrueckii]